MKINVKQIASEYKAIRFLSNDHEYAHEFKTALTYYLATPINWYEVN